MISKEQAIKKRNNGKQKSESKCPQQSRHLPVTIHRCGPPRGRELEMTTAKWCIKGGHSTRKHQKQANAKGKENKKWSCHLVYLKIGKTRKIECENTQSR